MIVVAEIGNTTIHIAAFEESQMIEEWYLLTPKKTASENSNRQTKNTYSPIRNQNLQDFLEQQQMIFKLDKILTKTEMLNFAERANKQILELNNK